MTFVLVVFVVMVELSTPVDAGLAEDVVVLEFFAVIFTGGATAGEALVQLARRTATPMLAGSPAAPSSPTRGWGVVPFVRRETALRAIDTTSVKLAGIEDEGAEVGGGRVVLEKTE